jgi:hypothetical protein
MSRYADELFIILCIIGNVWWSENVHNKLPNPGRG